MERNTGRAKAGLLLTTAFASICLLSGGTVARAQATTATLVGSVSDASGASIPRATVELTEQSTSQHYTNQTNEGGNYEFTLLPPGTYAVKVTDQGFQVSVTQNVQATVNSTVRTDVQLKTGDVSQTVTVTDQLPALQTDRADVSAQLQSKQIVELPVGNSRNFQALESLVPGVSASFYDHSSFFDAQNSQSFNVNGQAETANNLQLEGIDDNERTGLLQVYVPPAAAIQTVDVETSNYAPEFGRSAGAVTNVTIKSGSNDFHGSAYEYNEVSSTGARNYFNRTGKFPRFTNNYYGGTVGGPILKNRTFFFGDFLRYSNHQSQFNLFTVPTAAFRTGDLSASPTPIYDPATGDPATGKGRTQFANNRIPAARFSPVAQNILALIPEPNTNGTSTTNNYQVNTGFDQDTNTFDIKLDQKLGAEDHLSYRYSWQHTTTLQDPAFGLAGGPGNSGGNGTNHVYNTAGDYTHLFSPALFTEVRVGVNHYRNSVRQSDYGTAASTNAGIPGVNVNPFTSGLAAITINTYSAPIVGYNASYPWDRGESNIDVANNWTRLLGNHSLKFGVEIRRVRDDLTQGQTYGPRGAYTYADGQTGLNAAGSATSFGNDFASFLLDLPSGVGRDVNVNDASWRQTLYFGFIQDTFQATRDLTLTYGLRWEFYPPANPRATGGFSQYDPSTNSLDVAGYGAIPKDLGLRVNYRDFQPRVGAAYRAGSRAVVRAGFGISNTPFQDNNYAFNYPVRQNISFNAVNSYVPALEGTAVANLATGFGPAPVAAIPASGVIANAPAASQWNVVNPQYKDPTVLSYNLTFEQDLGHGWVGNVAYVGNVGRQIPAYYNLNAGLIAGAGAAGQPEFATYQRTAVTNLMGKGTNSNYNGLQARLLHRFSNGLSATSGYAYQKSMGFVSTTTGLAGFNFYLDPARDYSPLNWNRTHVFTQSFVYELPVGKGKRYLQGGPIAAVLGGWQVSGVFSAATGTPLFITASGSQLNAPGNTQVPNLVKPFNRLHSIGSGRQWFDRTSFAAPSGPVLGNLGKNVYSGPGYATFDSTLSRNIPIHERYTLQLRADGFNALNHPTFSNPTVDSTSNSFGQVLSTANSGPRVLQFAATLNF